MQHQRTLFWLSLWFVLTLLSSSFNSRAAQAAALSPRLFGFPAPSIGSNAQTTADPFRFAEDPTVMPDLSGVVLTLDDLPAGFAPLAAAELASMVHGMGLVDMGIENYFGFQNFRRPTFIFGFVGLTSTNLERASFDSVVANPQDAFMLSAAVLPSGYALQPLTTFPVTAVGDKAVGMTTIAENTFGAAIRLDIILFRREMVGAIVVSAYPEGQTPALSAAAAAQRLDAQAVAAITGAPAEMASVQQSTPPANPVNNRDEIARSAESLPEAEVLVKQLNVRAGPGVTYSVVDGVRSGERLSIVGQTGNCAWLQVVMPNGTVGWISGMTQYVSRNTPCSAITAPANELSITATSIAKSTLPETRLEIASIPTGSEVLLASIEELGLTLNDSPDDDPITRQLLGVLRLSDKDLLLGATKLIDDRYKRGTAPISLALKPGNYLVFLALPPKSPLSDGNLYDVLEDDSLHGPRFTGTIRGRQGCLYLVEILEGKTNYLTQLWQRRGDSLAEVEAMYPLNTTFPVDKKAVRENIERESSSADIPVILRLLAKGGKVVYRRDNNRIILEVDRVDGSLYTIIRYKDN